MKLWFCRIWNSVLLLALVILAPGSAHSAEGSRHALVIGNSKYVSSPLSSPAIDAEQVARKLERAGYLVTLRFDLKRDEFRRELFQFAKLLNERKGRPGLVYYSGHGMQIDGHNYLIPVDSEISSEDDVRILGIRLDEIILRLKSADASPGIVILDACRNNPFEKSFKSQADGLARPNLPSGILVAFAAAPGAVAPQARGGRPSPYTEALLTEIDASAPALVVLQRVANKVLSLSGGKQMPHVESSAGIDLEFSFSNSPQTAAAALPLVLERGRPALPNNASKLDRFLAGEVVPANQMTNGVFRRLQFSIQLAGSEVNLSRIRLAIEPTRKFFVHTDGDATPMVRQFISEGRPMYLAFDLRTETNEILTDGGRICCYFDKGMGRSSSGLDAILPQDAVTLRLKREITVREIASGQLSLWVYTTADGVRTGSDGFGYRLASYLAE